MDEQLLNKKIADAERWGDWNLVEMLLDLKSFQAKARAIEAAISKYLAEGEAIVN